jgi:hypothetical protein
MDLRSVLAVTEESTKEFYIVNLSRRVSRGRGRSLLAKREVW